MRLERNPIARKVQNGHFVLFLKGERWKPRGKVRIYVHTYEETARVYMVARKGRDLIAHRGGSSWWGGDYSPRRYYRRYPRRAWLPNGGDVAVPRRWFAAADAGAAAGADALARLPKDLPCCNCLSFCYCKFKEMLNVILYRTTINYTTTTRLSLSQSTKLGVD